MNLFEMYKLFPVLKTGDSTSLHPDKLAKTIVAPDDGTGLVAFFAFDTPENFVYLEDKMVEDETPDKMIADAYANLEAAPASFELMESFQNHVLDASGHTFSSEKLICRNHMFKIHELLNTNMLLVSVARRTYMRVLSGEASKDIFDQFIASHYHTWNDTSSLHEQITDAIFIVLNGNIENMYTITED